jgi:predicted methyltransferase
MRTATLSAATLIGLSLATGVYAGLHMDKGLPAYIVAAVGDGARPDADRQRDAERKPGETLAFAGVKPGDQVVELAPGGGYYTRLLSAVVGPKARSMPSPPRPSPMRPRAHRSPALRCGPSPPTLTTPT